MLRAADEIGIALRIAGVTSEQFSFAVEPIVPLHKPDVFGRGLSDR
jgi:hypothetical protein